MCICVYISLIFIMTILLRFYLLKTFLYEFVNCKPSKTSFNGFSSSFHLFLSAADSNWNLNTYRGELPSKQGDCILLILSDTTRTGSGRLLFKMLIYSSIITNFPSKVFSRLCTFMSTAFSKCVTLSSTPVILSLTDSWISCSFPVLTSSSFLIIYYRILYYIILLRFYLLKKRLYMSSFIANQVKTNMYSISVKFIIVLTSFVPVFTLN